MPAGSPADLTVHVKNGWLPLATHGWRIHSIGCFTGHHRGYSIVVLTEDNPTMQYGITTIQAAARVIHRQLNPPGTATIAPAQPAPSWAPRTSGSGHARRLVTAHSHGQPGAGRSSGKIEPTGNRPAGPVHLRSPYSPPGAHGEWSPA